MLKNFGYKKGLGIGLFAFLLLLPLIVFYAVNGNSFDTRSRAGDVLVLPDDYKAGDLNSDLRVTVSDFTVWVSYYRAYTNNHSYDVSADLNNDSEVTVSDFIEWLAIYRSYKSWYKSDTAITTLYLYLGDTKQLTYRFSRTDMNINGWSSSDEKTVLVDSNGKVTAKGTGYADVSVSGYIGDVTDSATVRIIVLPHIQSIKFDNCEDASVGDSFLLRTVVYSTDGDLITDSVVSETFSWTSTNASVVSVDRGSLIAITKGVTTITVTTRDGVTATCNMTVR